MSNEQIVTLICAVGLFVVMLMSTSQRSRIEDKLNLLSKLPKRVSLSEVDDAIVISGETTFSSGVINIDVVSETKWSDSIHINLGNKVSYGTWQDSEGVSFRVFNKEAEKCGKK